MAVREDDVVFADGSAGIYGVVDKPDYALIVPFEDGGFHLVEQYRYPVGGRFWEFPQGSWSGAGPAPDGGPAALAAAELREETGLRAGRMTYLGRLHVAYGYANQRCHVVLAEHLVPGEPGREASEYDMRQRWVNRSELLTLVRTGAVSDSATIAAYTLFCLHESAPGTLEPR
jgi:8-oxo-dGTP pyrophosphatase MutT (NUDIX family)